MVAQARTVVRVPKALQGKVIGRQGATLRDIESDYPGVKLYIPRRDDPSEEVCITGPEDGVRRAKERVLDICGLRSNSKDDRKHAANLFKEADLLFKQAKSVKNNRQKRDKLWAMAKQKQQEAYKAQKQAAKTIFRAKNSGYGRDQIDLHGLYVKEALFAVEERLKLVDKDLRSGQLPSLTIITGAGHHSENNRAKIKPEIIKLLRKHKYPFVEEGSGGILLVSYAPEISEQAELPKAGLFKRFVSFLFSTIGEVFFGRKKRQKSRSSEHKQESTPNTGERSGESLAKS